MIEGQATVDIQATEPDLVRRAAGWHAPNRPLTTTSGGVAIEVSAR